MCCLFAILVFLGPRIAGIIWWIAQPNRWVGASGIAAFDTWIWPVLGLLFLPWTTLMYVILAPGGIVGIWEWLFLILAVVFDISSYAGSGYGNKDKIPGM